jgi:hypothetical protein
VGEVSSSVFKGSEVLGSRVSASDLGVQLIRQSLFCYLTFEPLNVEPLNQTNDT